MNETAVPASLRAWFVVHFLVDILFAVPLMLAPVYTLSLFGWQQVDPFTARLVAAALFAIGIESFLGRNADRSNYRAMLNLKIIWSLAAVTGLLLSMFHGAQGSPAGSFCCSRLLTCSGCTGGRGFPERFLPADG